MKRFFLWAVAGALLFVFFFFGFNLFDSRWAPGTAAVHEDPGAQAENLQPGNGFFIVWGFAEPPGTEPLDAEYLRRVEELFASRSGNAMAGSPYRQWLARLNAVGARHWSGANFYFPQRQGEDVADHFAARRVLFAEQQRRFAPLLPRFQRLLDAGEIMDFTPLGRECPTRSLKLAIHAAKLFSAGRVLAALDGRWQEAANGLLQELEAGLRLIAGGRTIQVNALGRTMVELALRSLASLLNRRECPLACVRLVQERLPDRPIAFFGTAAARDFHWRSFRASVIRIKNERIVDPFLLKDFFREPAAFYALERFVAISGPRIFTAAHALAAFFLKENETSAMMRDYWDGIGRLEQVPPWKWGETAGTAARRGRGPGPGAALWWLRNPLGKMMVRSAIPFHWPIVRNFVQRGHETKARYDLVRVLVRARLEAAPGEGLEEAGLRRLLATADERDPYSGRPFLFSRARAVVYSIGADGVDDDGRERPELWRDSDIAVPIKFVKSEK